MHFTIFLQITVLWKHHFSTSHYFPLENCRQEKSDLLNRLVYFHSPLFTPPPYNFEPTYTAILERSFWMSLDLLLSSLQSTSNFMGKGWLWGKKWDLVWHSSATLSLTSLRNYIEDTFWVTRIAWIGAAKNILLAQYKQLCYSFLHNSELVRFACFLKQTSMQFKLVLSFPNKNRPIKMSVSCMHMQRTKR